MNQDRADNLAAADRPILSDRRVPLDLLLLAMPIIATMVSRTVMSFVDFVMVSKLGTEAQAAILPAQILLFCMISFGMGMMSVVNSFVAQSLGRRQYAECSAYAWQGLHLSVGIGLALLPAWFVVPALFAGVGHEAHVQQMEVIYVQIGILGVGPTTAALALANFFTGIQRPAVGFGSALISNLFNVAANYTLIFGHFGFEPMGIAGAAWATLLAAILQMAILLAWMLRPRINHLYRSRQTWRPSRKRLGTIAWFGLPAGFQFMIDIASWTIFALFLVGQFGTVQLAANNLAFKLLELSFMPTVGVGVAVTATVGKAIGQRRYDLARLTVRWGILFGSVYMGLVAVLYLMLRYQMVGLMTSNPAVVHWAVRILVLCAVFQVFDALCIIYGGALRGAGDNHWPALVISVYAAVIFLGGGWLITRLAPQWGSLGPWIAATVYIIVLGTTLWARFVFGPWEKIKMIQPAVGATEAKT